MLAFRLAAGEVSGPVFTSTATRARVGSIIMWPPPGSATLGLQQRLDQLGHAEGGEGPVPVCDLVGRGVGPVAPSRFMRVGAIDQQFRAAGHVGQHGLGEVAHGGDVFGDLVILRAVAGGAQDQAQRRRSAPAIASVASASSTRAHVLRPGCGARCSGPGRRA